MRQLTKYFLWIGCLAVVAQSAWAFSLLGPVGSAGTTGGTVEDNWQITDIGYDPLPNNGALPFIGTTSHTFGPKNLGEGYRYNTPVIYYTFDPDFVWFGSDGEAAVGQAMDMLNGVLNGQTNTPMFVVSTNMGVLMGGTNGVFNGPAVALSPANGIDKYSTNLYEFPLNSQGINYQAQALGLTDLKSTTLALMVEQLGLADAVRYTWGLLNRWVPPGVTCTPTTPPSVGPVAPNGVEYWVIPRNYDIVPSSLTSYQYSPYVNTELYSYYIWETCDPPPPFAPPIADALEIPVDPLNNNPPVASGALPGEGISFNDGIYYTGLTRDDAGGLRYLLSTNNIFDTAGGYREQPAGGSVLFSTNFDTGAEQLLSTTNLTTLVSVSSTNDPATLQALFPDLQFTLLTNYPALVTSIANVTYTTNTPVGYPGPIIVATTNYVTTPVIFYKYSFDNIVTNPFHPVFPATTYQFQTITYGPVIGQPVGSAFAFQTNYQSFQSNIISGDYFIITNGECGPDILQTVQTNVDVVTNFIAGATNTADGSFFVQNLVYYATNYVFWVHPCTLVTNAVADYQGIGRMQFVRVSDDNYDYQSGQFITPITNQYSMVVITNHQYVTRYFQRVVTRPDVVFGAESLLVGSGNANLAGSDVSDTQPNFIDSRGPNLAGPGIIDPTTSTNISIIFNAVGPVYYNTSPSSMIGPDGAGRATLSWGSFDGTTNAPIVYPNGTSIANLAAEAFFQISPPPPTLTSGTVGTAYSVTLTATGGQPPYTWTLAPNSAGLPPGLTLLSGGVISGTPTQSGTFDNIVIQMTDSSVPSANVVDTVYSLTIN